MCAYCRQQVSLSGGFLQLNYITNGADRVVGVSQCAGGDRQWTDVDIYLFDFWGGGEEEGTGMHGWKGVEKEC